ncbi:MAG: AraC family transcriptional regulator [Clostridiaceae bacterium]|nr:AraC family transcriptional regulator [Clostridiaceae bacterium]
MNRKYYNSRTFWKTFLSYILLLTTIISVLAVLSWYGVINRAAADAKKVNTEYVSSITLDINRQIEELAVYTQQLRKVTWVQKLYSGSSVFDPYFDATRRLEIIKELPLYQSNSGMVQRIALIFPQRDVSVSTYGWLAIGDFLRLNGMADADLPRIIAEDQEYKGGIHQSAIMEQSLPDRIVLISALENISEPRAYVCYFIGKQQLRDLIQRMMPVHLADFTINDRTTGNTVLTVEETNHTEGPADTRTAQSVLLNWKYSFTFYNGILGMPAEQLFSQLAYFLFFFILGIFLSFGLAFLTYRPLGSILTRALQNGGQAGRGVPDRGASDYNIIEHSFDHLEQENAHMRDLANRYDGIVRSDVVKKLLKGYFDQNAIERDLAQYKIPFCPEFYYQVIAISADDTGSRPETYAAVDLIEKLGSRFSGLTGCRYEIVDSMDSDMIIIAAFSGEQDAGQITTAFIRELALLARSLLNQHALVSVGVLHQGFIGISVSFHFAMERRLHSPRSWEYVFSDESSLTGRYYYPLEWENQLIASLKAGNLDSCLNILEELRRENKQLKLSDSQPEYAEGGLKLIALIVESLLRIASELNISDRLFMEDIDVIFTNESFDHKWDCLVNICREICRSAERPQENNCSVMGQKMRDYVDDHYTDSSLCLKQLGDQFHTSIQTISKIFKATADETFYSYLYHKRMELACTLLRTTDAAMAAIAKQIGYDNEFSFKRAFVRYAGVRPRDYKRNHQDTPDIEP